MFAALTDNEMLAMSLRSALIAYLEKPTDLDAVTALLGSAAALPHQKKRAIGLRVRF